MTKKELTILDTAALREIHIEHINKMLSRTENKVFSQVLVKATSLEVLETPILLTCGDFTKAFSQLALNYGLLSCDISILVLAVKNDLIYPKQEYKNKMIGFLTSHTFSPVIKNGSSYYLVNPEAPKAEI